MAEKVMHDCHCACCADRTDLRREAARARSDAGLSFWARLDGATKRHALRVAAGALLFLLLLLWRDGAADEPRLDLNEGLPRLLLLLAAYLILAYDVLFAALKNILAGRVFDENFLMAAATLGAFAIGEYPEGLAVMLFYQIGEGFQAYALARSRRSVAALLDIRPDRVTVLGADGEPAERAAEEVAVGEHLLIKAGERVALDARVIQGESLIDSSALTGESEPRAVAPGDELLSGCINLRGGLVARVERSFSDSTLSKILAMVEEAAERKSRSERFITRFARHYTPAVVGLAALLALLPPLLLPGQRWGDWIYRALAFMVVSCPCALVISLPLSFFGGIGAASKQGILIKGSNFFESLAKTEIVLWDKTGTLTEGRFELRQIRPAGLAPEALLELAAHAEAGSTHPISLSLLSAYGKKPDLRRVEAVEELPGRGLRARVDGRDLAVGNLRLMRELGLEPEAAEGEGVPLYVAREGLYLGCLLVADAPKPDAARAVAELREAGVRRSYILSGDLRGAVAPVAEALGMDGYFAELLPADKLETMRRLAAELSSGSLCYVGDGINDAPVLAGADVGVAMGALGSDAAIEAADVVVMDDSPAKLATALRIARRTLRIAQQNIYGAIALKVLVLALSAAGLASLWLAVFADVGVSVLAILNAMRALRAGDVRPGGGSV